MNLKLGVKLKVMNLKCKLKKTQLKERNALKCTIELLR